MDADAEGGSMNETSDHMSQTHVEMSNLDSIRQHCDRLTTTDSVEKGVALEVLKVFHAMENLHHQQLRDSSKIQQNLQRELDITKLTYSRADTLSDLSTTSAAIVSENVEMKTKLAQLEQQLGELSGRVLQLEQILRASKRR